MSDTEKSIKDMTQQELMDLMERYEKAKINTMDVLDEAKAKDLIIKDYILCLSNEKKQLEIELICASDKTIRNSIKVDILKKQKEINCKKKERIPIERIIDESNIKIKKLQSVYERAKSRYFNNKL